MLLGGDLFHENKPCMCVGVYLTHTKIYGERERGREGEHVYEGERKTNMVSFELTCPSSCALMCRCVCVCVCLCVRSLEQCVGLSVEVPL